ncbi:MAG: hypothetical protein D3917_12800 [Candidatus Electrothrix sp. AX5]|nr:hypothetical protein [Candidatus Electrothrix sp. AX5]
MIYDKFDELLTKELSWRKHEVAQLVFATQKNQSSVLHKSLILMIYAHWEGFFKRSSKLYLQYVSNQKILLKELTYNYHAIHAKGQIKACFDSINTINIKNELKFIEKFSNKLDQKFTLRINYISDQDNSLVDTNNNLRPDVLKSLFNLLGFKYLPALEIREKYLNEYLINSRNSIGHGNPFDEEGELFSHLDEILKLKTIVFAIIDCYMDILLEYAGSKLYLQKNSEIKEEYDLLCEERIENIIQRIENS